MITPAPMELLSFVVLKDKVEEVSYRLLKLGSFHPVDIRKIEDRIKGLSLVQVDKEDHELEALQARIHDLTRKLKINPESFHVKGIRASSYDKIEERLKSLNEKLSAELSEQEELKQEIASIGSILSQVRDYFPFSLGQRSGYSFLEVLTGKLEEKTLAVLERSLAGAPHVIYPFRKENSRVLVLLIGLRPDRALFEKVLKDVGWEEINFPKDSEHLSAETEKELGRKIEEARKKIQEVGGRIRELGMEYRQDLSDAIAFVKLKKSLLEARRYACVTERTALFSGWVPQAEKNRVISEIKSMGDVSYIESRDPEELGIPPEEVPVSFQHTAIVKPFEMLIGAYGIPRYGTIDPTIFVAISFLVMFGAMFGDLGQGLVLALAGLAIYLKKSPGAEAVRQAGKLILYCGLSSAVFGVLYGSVFGIDFNSVWLKPMNDISGIFRAGIFLGITMITLGIVLNVINAFKTRDYAKAIFDKAGLIGGVVYWAAIGGLSKMFLARVAMAPVYLYLILGGILAIFIFPIIDNFFIHKRGGFVESLMESVVNILEIFMGYLSNTVSFIRVGAFALAHAGLFWAVFSLSRLTDIHSALGNLLSWSIIVAGNILIICLEGLIVSIQALRLNYYEFFSKFFITGKRMYKPLS